MTLPKYEVSEPTDDDQEREINRCVSGITQFNWWNFAAILVWLLGLGNLRNERMRRHFKAKH